MHFDFTRQNLGISEQRLERALEIVPGALSWSLLIGMAWLGWWKPIVAAALIIAYDLYWLLRIFYMTFFLIVSSIRLSLEKHTDWMDLIHRFDSLREGSRANALAAQRHFSLRRKLTFWLHRRELLKAHQGDLPAPSSESIFHMVLFPMIKEPAEVLEEGIKSLAQQSLPTNRLLVVLAVESRSDPRTKRDVHAIAQRYRTRFLELLVVEHPDGLPGEARVKGANVTYAAKAAVRWFTDRGVCLEHVVVSCFDTDTIVSPDYFSCLTFAYLTTPWRNRASFQPIPVYHNNIWEVPGFARVLDIGSSFFQLIEATNPEKLVTFSSHSMSCRALVEVDYWPTDLISDDSAIFWKAFIHYDADYHVIPLPVTVSMDVACAASWQQTAAQVFRQKRRWAWGVENFPIVVRAFLRADRISFWIRLRKALRLLEGHISWATSAFLLTVIGWLPAFFAGREFSDSVLYYSAPRITATVFHLASLALMATVLLSLCLLPKPPAKYRLWRLLAHTVEWLLVPLIVLFFSALPALDAQTKLMRGRYLEFWVTGKRQQRQEKHKAVSVAAAVTE
ncbi:MAG: glycosyltransferase family 2 protein [Candidatus Omnitrophica bacterium]|nr:glycosyltransferase family 2 protein [Candidatus Omnitrophota bacterium]